MCTPPETANSNKTKSSSLMFIEFKLSTAHCQGGYCFFSEHQTAFREALSALKNRLWESVNILSFQYHYICPQSPTQMEIKAARQAKRVLSLCHNILMKCFIEGEISLIIWFTEKEGREKRVPASYYDVPSWDLRSFNVFIRVPLKWARVSWMAPLI